MKVLVTAAFTDQGLDRLRNELKMDVVYDPWRAHNRILMSDELALRLQAEKAEAVILEVDLCHDEVFEAVDLKFVGCCRGEPLNVDVDTATEKGVPVFFTPGRNADAVADLALCFMLCHLRKVVPIHNLLTSGDFNPDSVDEFMAMLTGWTGFELGGRVVGIVGLGAVGSAVARRVKAFGSKIIAYDPFAPAERFSQFDAEKVELLDVFKRAGIVTLHAADLDENQGMITRQHLAAMKPDAVFLNLARSSLVDNDALYEALQNHRIAGAGLDVFSSEPPKKDDRFLSLDNVIVTPHVGGMTHDVIRHQTDIIIADVAAFLSGKKPRFCANPEVLKKK
ncbi:MAG TPA: NAD(P)-dependent oxidoreductase [bacterium]|nr:NAD(P)-dependent oxidoreductase [bacterium]